MLPTKMFSLLKIKNKNTNSFPKPIEESIGNNDVILRNIFQNLHGEDLKTCRLVCRKWREVSQLQFKAEMNVVLEENSVSIQEGNRERNFEAFVHDFDGRHGELPLESFTFRINFIKEDKWTEKWLESYGNVIKNLKIVVCHSRRKMLMNQLWAFRYIIFRYIYNVENLSLIFIASNKQNIPEHSSPKDFKGWINFAGIKDYELPCLKSIKYFVHEKSSWSYDPKNEVIQTLYDIICATRNLEILEMNLNPNHIETLLQIPSENLLNLRELSLADWKCSYFQVYKAIKYLSEVGMKLKLHSFCLQCTCPHYGYSGVGDILRHTRFLLVFLRSQKDYLKKLSLTHPPFPGSASNAKCKDPFVSILKGRDEFNFPKLENLERLSLCNSYRNFAWLFSGNPNWAKLFPKLKRFDYRYIIESGNCTFPQLIRNITIPCESVREITLAVNTFVFGSYSNLSEDEKNRSLKLFCLVREKFINLKLLKVLSEKTKLEWICEGGRDGFSHFHRTYILYTIGDQNFERIVVNEYKSLKDIEEDNTTNLQKYSVKFDQEKFTGDKFGYRFWLRHLNDLLLYFLSCFPQDSDW